MADFAAFDQRGYPTVSVREGYGAWQPSYEDTVLDLMDLALLDRLETVDWSDTVVVADLGCGSGRTARWLASKGVVTIDGVDLTPEMLDRARELRLHRRLEEADVRATRLAAATYDVAVCSLVDEHLPQLGDLYAEARRLLLPDGVFVVVGYHPYFIMTAGMPTHFDGPDGRAIAIETYVHLPSAHVAAARASGLVALEMYEAVIDDAWVRRKPKWDRYRGWPISFAWAWRAAP
ncbi:MAG: class I SAM-dependent methyltransferase [Acidimicrobiales bacterium]